MIKLYFDGNEINKDYYRSLSQSYILFDKSFCLGSVPSNTFKIELNSDANVSNFEAVKIELDDNDYAHVFYDNADDSNGSKNIISLSDRMVDFEFGYDASPLINASENGYVTILEILEDICSKKGVTLATKNFNLKDKQITWYDSTISARKYISYIATLNGGFARISRSGELELVKYTNTIKSEINVNTCLDYKVGEYHKITRVVWDIGADKWEYGDETGNTLYLDTDNPFITKAEDVESIYNLINGFEFYSIEISKCPIDSNINIGDTIALKIGDTLYPFIAQLELSYNGGFHGGYSFIVNTEKVEETSINDTEKNIKSIKSRLNRDEAELEIIAEQSKENSKNLNDLSNPILTKEGNNHICLDGAYETNAIEYNIKGKSEQKQISNLIKLPNGYTLTKDYIDLSINSNIIKIDSSDTTNMTTSFTIPIEKLEPNIPYYLRIMSWGNSQISYKSMSLSYKNSSNSYLEASSQKIAEEVEGDKLKRVYKIESDKELEAIHFLINVEKRTDDSYFYMQVQIDDGGVSPTNPSEIKTIKGIRNLFNKDTISNGFINSNGNIVNESGVCHSDFIYLEKNKTYLFSGRGTWQSVGIYNLNKTFKERKAIINTYVPSENEYVMVNCLIEDKDKVMLEESSVAHSYVPYGSWLKSKVTGKNLFDKTKAIGGLAIDRNNGNLLTSSSYSIYSTSDFILVKPNVQYFINLSYASSYYGIVYYDTNKNYISGERLNNIHNTPNNCRYIRITWNNTEYNKDNIQIEEGKIQTSYESYKEKEVLVDINKPNLFDKDKATYTSAIPDISEITSNVNYNRSFYIKINPNTTYTISRKKIGSRFVIGTTANIPNIGESILYRYENNNGNKITIHSSSNTNYLIVYYLYNQSENEAEILNNIQIYEGYSPYYELCSIGEAKDNLEVVNGHLDKRIGKYAFTGNETFAFIDSNKRIGCSAENIKELAEVYISIPESNNNTTPLFCTHYNGNQQSNVVPESNNVAFSKWNNIIYFYFPADYETTNNFKSWLKEQYDNGTPVTVYYELEHPEEVSLTPTEVPLFDGENHITLLEDIETVTNIKYYKKNALTEAYQTKVESQAQMRITSEEITNSVSSTRTELKNDLMVTNEKFNQYALQQVLVEQINSVLQKITDSEARISILNQTIANGVPITKTETGYTFDINGLNVSSTDAEVNSTLSSIGLSILDNIQKLSLLFAGYDKDLQETIVRAQNMIIQKYLMVPHSRYEKYNNPTFGEGTGCFYVD